MGQAKSTWRWSLPQANLSRSFTDKHTLAQITAGIFIHWVTKRNTRPLFYSLGLFHAST